MADAKPIRPLSAARWSALAAWFKATQDDKDFVPVEIEIVAPVETQGFIFLRGLYRAA